MAKKLSEEELRLKEFQKQHELEEYKKTLPLEILKLIVKADKENIDITYLDNPITVSFWHVNYWNDGESISLEGDPSELELIKDLIEEVKQKKIEAEIKQQKFNAAKSKLNEFKESLTKEELALLKGHI